MVTRAGRPPTQWAVSRGGRVALARVRRGPHSPDERSIHGAACVSRKIGAHPPAAATTAAAVIARTDGYRSPPSPRPDFDCLSFRDLQSREMRPCRERIGSGWNWSATGEQVAVNLVQSAGGTVGNTLSDGRKPWLEMGHDTTTDEPEMLPIGISEPIDSGRIAGSELPNIPARMAKP